ncbi:MAG: FAD-dependent monooxygenase [Prochloraceae cyanobacterium]|nr:FAD-dependent monooxygenase [Prochloraceae cyanobacterium]
MVASDIPSIKLDRDAAETFLKTKPSHEYWSRCDRSHNREGQVVLIGDAAHNMFSILGQGCTVALADVMALDELLQKHQNDLSVVLPKFSEQQVKEGHAASDLNLIALILYHAWLRQI